jgi:hypothetical protein
LRGFTSELEGNEGRLIFAYPVVSAGDEFFFFESADDPLTELPSLTPLRASDRENVRWLRDDLVGEISLDEGLWIAGPAIAHDRLSVEGLHELAGHVMNWSSLGDGFRWTTGTYRSFVDLVQRTAKALERDLHRSIFALSRQAGSPGGPRLDRVFAHYSSFDRVDSLQRSLNCALYYDETIDFDRRELVSEMAVVAQQVGDRAHFDAELSRLKDFVLMKRLREHITTGKASPGAFGKKPGVKREAQKRADERTVAARRGLRRIDGIVSYSTFDIPDGIKPKPFKYRGFGKIAKVEFDVTSDDAPADAIDPTRKKQKR